MATVTITQEDAIDRYQDQGRALTLTPEQKVSRAMRSTYSFEVDEPMDLTEEFAVFVAALDRGERGGPVVAKGTGVQKRRIANLMRRAGWAYDVPRSGLRRRLYCLAMERHPWWDWGHRLMILTGSDFGGNWSEPEPPTWWYRLGTPKRMWRTGYPRHPLSTFQIVTDYDEFRRLTKGLNEDQMYEWKAIAVNQDGELILGHRYWGKDFYGMTQAETALLRRYLRMWHGLDWFGLRGWLYSQALHAAVHRKQPLTCQVTPAKGTGGYDHWYCGLPRRHSGPHRYNNYTWDGDPEHRVEYDPEGPEIDAQRARVIEEAAAALSEGDR